MTVCGSAPWTLKSNALTRGEASHNEPRRRRRATRRDHGSRARSGTVIVRRARVADAITAGRAPPTLKPAQFA
jgi:hypothetical protein